MLTYDWTKNGWQVIISFFERGMSCLGFAKVCFFSSLQPGGEISKDLHILLEINLTWVLVEKRSIICATVDTSDLIPAGVRRNLYPKR